RFSWYSMDDKIDHNGYLFDFDQPAGTSRTAFGTNFAAYTSALSEEVDLYPVQLRMSGVPPLISRGATTLTLEASIANSGNLIVPTQANVQFYNGDPENGGTPIGAPASVTIAGCGEQQTVRLEWPDVDPGVYEVYVVVDGDGAVQ